MTAPPNHNTADQSGAEKFAVRIADFRWHICDHDEFHRSLWQLGIGAAIKCVVRLSDGTGIQYFDREPNELLSLVQAAEIFDAATPQPFPAPAVQSGELSHFDRCEFMPADMMFGDPITPSALKHIVSAAIAQTAPAVAGDSQGTKS